MATGISVRKCERLRLRVNDIRKLTIHRSSFGPRFVLGFHVDSLSCQPSALLFDAIGVSWRKPDHYLMISDHKGRQMKVNYRIVVLACLVAVVCLPSIGSAQGKADPQPESSVIGRWDLTVQGPEGQYPSWIEIERSGRRSLVGRYVGQFGSARPVSKVEFEQGTIRFSVPPQWENRKIDVDVEGHIDGDVLRGDVTGDNGERLRWEARRAPMLLREAPKSWGSPISLLNGRDLAGWKPRHSNRRNGWIVRDGILVNAEPANDLVSERKFNDFKLNAEFRFPSGSNSGIFLRGRYEVQIQRTISGQETDSHRFGGVYGYLTPSLNAAKPAGQWQSVEITLIGRQITVILNGEPNHRPTINPRHHGRRPLDSKESDPGPIMIQGDHGIVEFRPVTVTPAIVE